MFDLPPPSHNWIMVDPISAVLGAVILFLAAATLWAAYRQGAARATSPDHIVDMQEVNAYYRQVSSNQALQQDVQDTESGSEE